MRYRACRRVKQYLRQELSLSDGCLVTLMENELWQTIPQKPLPQLASLLESQVPWEEGMPLEEMSRRHPLVCRWGW